MPSLAGQFGVKFCRNGDTSYWWRLYVLGMAAQIFQIGKFCWLLVVIVQGKQLKLLSPLLLELGLDDDILIAVVEVSRTVLYAERVQLFDKIVVILDLQIGEQ